MLSDKFIKKYMRVAKLIGEDQNPCLSRNIGVVIVDPINNRIASTGYNGPPKDTPHCDSPEYLTEVVWPQLTTEEKGYINSQELEEYNTFVERGKSIRKKFESGYYDNVMNGESLIQYVDGNPSSYEKSLVAPKKIETADDFCERYVDCKLCPRRIVGALSGTRTELCSCEHAERNAIYNSTECLNGFAMLCYCGIPCWECCKAIINAKLGYLYCLDKKYGNKDYASAYDNGYNRWLLSKSKTKIILVQPDVI